MLQLFWVLVAFSLMYTLKPAAGEIDILECINASGQGQMGVDEAVESASAGDLESLQQGMGDACFGVSAVLRMTFALFLFHALMLLLILPRNDCASVIHDGGWIFKFILVGGLFVAFFWIPISVFQVWAEISRYVSILFLLIEGLYVLIAAITFNDYLINTKTNDETWRNVFMLIYTIFLTACSVTLLVLSFIWFLGTGAGDETDFEDLEAIEETGE